MAAAAPGSALSIPLASVFIGARLAAPRHSKGFSEALAVADYTNGDAFDRERVAPEIDLDRRELRVLSFQLHGVAPAPEALHRDFVAQARHDDLAAARLLGAMHREQVAIEDADVAHRHAAHAQQIVGARREEVRVDLVASLQVLFGEDRRTGGHAPHHRQLEQLPSAVAGPAIAYPDAARSARRDLDRALFLQRAQMLFGRVHRAKPHTLGDFRARRRIARHLGELAHEAQDFRLAVG